MFDFTITKKKLVKWADRELAKYAEHQLKMLDPIKYGKELLARDGHVSDLEKSLREIEELKARLEAKGINPNYPK